MSPDLLRQLRDLAARHGLELDPTTLTLSEVGLDFRVGIGSRPNGERWVLRAPRRPGMEGQIAAEANVLRLVASELPVAVPDWRIRSAELIAYPALPGEPGLTVDDAGALRWRLDLGSRRYAEEFGRLLAKLHGIEPGRARAAGVQSEEPAEVRQRWRRDIAAVSAEFRVVERLRQRWELWLADDSYWPEWSVVTHGELYPAHVLVDEADAITGVLDWTTAKISDPARDFAFQREIAPPESFELTLQSYQAAGGRVWPRLGEHAAELWSASPIAYGLYALQTGKDEHRAAAQAQLAPEQ
jgi:macrolide phosphotransferase